MASAVNNPNHANKLKTKAAVEKIRNGKSSVKQVLRQRFRTKLKENRNELFYARRAGLADENNIHNTLTEIVRRELSDLTTMDDKSGGSLLFTEPLSQDEMLELENEILAEEDWMYQEYERLLEEDRHMLELYVEQTFEDAVICPICEKTNLIENFTDLSCTFCKLSLPRKVNLAQLSSIISGQINAHSAACSGQISFMTIPENNTLSLYLTCETCECLSMIL